MAKYYDIDPETCSLEELERTINELDLKEQQFNTQQLAAKVFLNSLYGAMGASFYNLSGLQLNGSTATVTDLAESITLQSQHLIKRSVVYINEYFRNLWCQDFDVHKEIADKMKDRFPQFDAEKFLSKAKTNQLNFDTLQIYGDTDSAYITLQPLIDACDIDKDYHIFFCLVVYECAMEKYLDGKFEEYAQEFHCEKNLEKFELEKISRSIDLMAKKNYFCDVAWLDSGAFLEPLSHITYTGYDVVKGSTPECCRKEMKYFCEFVLDSLNNDHVPSQGEIVKKLREIKSRFVLQSPNDISKSTSISEYNKFVQDDKSAGGPIFFEFDKSKGSSNVLRKLAVPIHVRAAAMYNNLLLTKSKKYLSKYSLLKSGDKVRFYYIVSDDPHDDNAVFGFVPDNFPLEFAPEMDIDKQFEKMLLSPLNRIIVSLGHNEIPPTLTYTIGLF